MDVIILCDGNTGVGAYGFWLEFVHYRDIHVNPERRFGGTHGEPPSEASQLRKGGPGVHPRYPRKFSKTYIANGAIYVIPELYNCEYY